MPKKSVPRDLRFFFGFGVYQRIIRRELDHIRSETLSEISLIRVKSNEHFVFLQFVRNIKRLGMFVERLSVVETVYVALEWTTANAFVFNETSDIEFQEVEIVGTYSLFAQAVAKGRYSPPNPVGAAVALFTREIIVAIEEAILLRKRIAIFGHRLKETHVVELFQQSVVIANEALAVQIRLLVELLEFFSFNAHF